MFLEKLESLAPPREVEYLDLQPADFKIGEGKKGTRRIFGGNVQFDEFEIKVIQEFKTYCSAKNTVIPSGWEDAAILRFLQATNFKFDPTISDIMSYHTWRQSTVPVLTKEVEEMLKQGILYVQGRDKCFRPLIVCQAYKLDVDKLNVDVFFDTITYFFDTIINKMMVPGKVENWVFIIDLNGMGVSNLPVSLMKRMMGFLSSKFRSRLYVMYVVNTPTLIWIPWNIAKGFLQETTTQKINFVKNSLPEDLFKNVPRSQVEKKYGGLYPDRTQYYWPPVFPTLDLKECQLVPGYELRSRASSITSLGLFKKCPSNECNFTEDTIDERMDQFIPSPVQPNLKMDSPSRQRF